ncbi:MAG: SUMF1/EgtB/PvdO family nonheme iron enzyme, partial [Bacteroidota bacterium]
LSSFVLAAERPSSVPSKITELKSKNWYREAANEWEEYLNTNSSDAIGWVEYYKAATFSGQPASALASIADKVQELYPESFASYYVGFQHEGWTTKGLELLDLALKIESSRTICLEDQLIRSELMGALLDRKLTSEAVYEAGLIHSSTLNYNYNLLMSVGEGGLLITDGLHTTVPIWVLQDVMNVRKDVSVLNLRLARSQPEYLDRVLAQKNLESSIEELLSEEHGQNIYYALTMPRNRLQKLESRLYVVGLASTSGSEDFKHFETLRTNIEEKFLMDYLTIDFNGEPKTATGNMLSANYIVPLLLLKEFYDNLDKPERSETLKNQILALAADSEIETRVQLLLSQRKTHTTFKPVELDIKDLEKHLNQIKGQLYASDVELDNKSYWAYMEYLRKNGYTELYEQGLPDLSKYDVITKAWLSNYFYSPENVKALNAKRKLGDYQDYPVLDITYENAKAYCEWLTVQYNAQEKKKYKKVLFRLPSKKEWTMAALGYKKFTSWNLEENTIELKTKEGNTSYSLAEYKITYPWGIHAWSLRNSITNDKDCYLANVDVGEDIICGAGIKGDGFVLPSPVGTYFANGLGLYDVVGNVAEMVDEEGIAMGGSWNHPEEESTILSENSYEGSDISVGFRLFMEVIEE